MSSIGERSLPRDVALLVKRICNVVAADVYFAVESRQVRLDFGYVGFPDYVGSVWGGSSAESG